MLALPDFTQSLVLDTDASNTGLGAVLTQIVNGKEQVLSYASRTLTRSEQKYCVTRHELLAVIKKFRPYLLGRRFTLHMDHGSLTWLQHFKNPEGQLARWLELLQEYDFTIVHRSGKQHVNADSLSRLLCSQCGWHSHLGPSLSVDGALQETCSIAAVNTFISKEQRYNIP